MLKRRSFKRPRSKILKPRNCIFCQGTSLDWKDAAVLKKFVSERGKILSRLKSGNCAYHQRRLAQAIKRARHVALIPFKSSI